MGELYFFELGDLSCNCTVCDGHIKLLPPPVQARIRQLQAGADQRLVCLSHLFLRALLHRALPRENLNDIIVTGAFGKPFLQGHPELQFNLSHTKKAVVIGLSNTPIGVDIERVRAADHRVVRRYFSEREQAYLAEGPADKNRRFFEIWTRKEAYIKYTGEGLSLPLQSFDVTQPDIAALMRSLTIRDYMISVCGASAPEQSAVQELSEEQVLQAIAEYARAVGRP